MPRRGENIYKRKDGRWEARYIYSFKEDGSPRYRSIYAADYLTVKKKQNDAKRKMDPRLFQSVRMKKNISFYGLLWLERLKPSSKESTYVRYHYLFSHYICPMIGDRLVYTFSNKDCEVFLNKLLLSGKSDGSGLAPKTVTDIRSVVKLILKTAEKEGELSLCNPELCPVKPVRKPLRILSLKEQQALNQWIREGKSEKATALIGGYIWGSEVEGVLPGVEKNHFSRSRFLMETDSAIRAIESKFDVNNSICLNLDSNRLTVARFSNDKAKNQGKLDKELEGLNIEKICDLYKRVISAYNAGKEQRVSDDIYQGYVNYVAKFRKPFVDKK